MIPVVDIVILSYRRPAYLRDAIASVLAQTFADFRLTVMDNASDSDVAAVVASFPDPRIRFIRHPQNIGPGPNWFSGLDAASAEFLMIFHDDDCLSPRMIERQVALFRERPDLSFVTTEVTMVRNHDRMMVFERPDDYEYEVYSSPQALLEAFFEGRTFGAASILYRTSIAKRERPDFARFANVGDRAYMLRLTAIAPCARLRWPRYNARSHPAQDSAQQSWSYVHELELAAYYRQFAGQNRRLHSAIAKMVAHAFAVRRSRPPFREWLQYASDRELISARVWLQLLHFVPRVTIARWARKTVPRVAILRNYLHPGRHS